jgi:DNA mismatch endonuclease, patch repair protein
LRRNKIRFIKHYNRLPGKPDIVKIAKKKAVFIDGDFWHGWQFDLLRNRLPSLYWVNKIGGNVKRDRKNRQKLKSMGWQILRMWQHNLERKKDKSLQKILSFLSD